MNTGDVLKGKWHEIKGQVKQKWGKLTDDDITRIDGRVEELKGRLQKQYGYGENEADRQVEEFIKNKEKDINQ